MTLRFWHGMRGCNTYGEGRQEQTTTAGKIGAEVGDAGATIQGLAEGLSGGAEALVTSPAAATGVGALVPAVGVGMALHGSATSVIGFTNLLKGGGENQHTIQGREEHQKFADKVNAKEGWKSEPHLKDPATGKTVKPDAVSKSGRPVELKPKTASGERAGKAALPKYERATGRKGRVVYYKKKP